MGEGSKVLVDVTGRVGWLRINNPRRRNALTPEIVDSLRVGLAGLWQDADVRCVVLTGGLETFCAGADLRAVLPQYEGGGRPPLADYLTNHYNKLVRDIARGPAPVVAAVNGIAAGAGMSLALACDVRVAGDTARFRSAFLDVGLVPDCGASYFLPRLIGWARATELTLLRDQLTAHEAVDMGLVAGVVPAQSLHDEAERIATRIADLPTKAVQATRQLFREAAAAPLDEVLAREAAAQGRVGATADHGEGIRAFIEKRKPSFGR
jgi:2-(1,2-epoxy-1,2-dihydrophenyl)acetyl-CoA isomerase